MPLSEEKFIDVNGIRTRYFDKGQGDTILLLHGSFFGEPFSSDCAANWSENFEGLSEFARVIAVDRLGQGHTDNPKRVEDYTMKAVGEHVRDFISDASPGPRPYRGALARRVCRLPGDARLSGHHQDLRHHRQRHARARDDPDA